MSLVVLSIYSTRITNRSLSAESEVSRRMPYSGQPPVYGVKVTGVYYDFFP